MNHKIRVINLIIAIVFSVGLSIFTKASNAEMCIIYILMYQTAERISSKNEQ